MLIWFSFFLSLGLILIIARHHLWLGLIAGAIALGLLNLDLHILLKTVLITLTDPEILLLALAVGIIPIIGGILQESGLLNDLVNNLQMKRKVFLGFSPALMGLLPLPGGALLSAPMLRKAGDDIQGDSYAAINVWFRHILIMIYPLGSLLPCSRMAQMDLYRILLYLIPAFAVFFLLGYIFLLHRISGNMPVPRQVNYRKLLIPLLIIFCAPVVHVILVKFGCKDEISLLCGITLALVFASVAGRINLPNFFRITRMMKPWKFFLIIIGIFLFLNIFAASNIAVEISRAIFSPYFLIIFLAAFLGFASGRIQLPISILLPLFLGKYNHTALTPAVFALMFSSVYIGYMLSPVHPCVSISVEYFQSSFKNFGKKLLLPGALSLMLLYLASLIFLHDLFRG